MATFNELQMLAEQDPALREALSELFATGDMQQFQAKLLKDAQHEKDTPMPGLIESRGMNVSPSPLAFLASTIKQIQGGQQEGAIQKAMADLISKKAKTADQYNAYIQSQAQKQLAAQAAAEEYANAGKNAMQPPVRPEEQWLEGGYDPLTGANREIIPQGTGGAVAAKAAAGPAVPFSLDPNQTQEGYGPFDFLRPRPGVAGNKMSQEELAKVLRKSGPQLGAPMSPRPVNPFGWLTGE